MAYLKSSNNHIVIATSEFIKVFPKDDNCDKKILSFKHEYKKNENENSATQVIDCVQFSPDYKYFAALFSDKTLKIWSTSEICDNFWEEIGSIVTKRRSTSLAFSPESDEIFVADKSGDLYSFLLQPENLTICDTEKMQPILGHISMLLDVTITDSYIITADRDEKIRVSERHRPYVINNFCLGHTEFVCRLVPAKGNHLISTSGDQTIMIWDIETGKKLQTIDTGDAGEAENTQNGEKIDDKSVPSLITYSSAVNFLAVANVDCPNPSINVYSVIRTSNPHIKLLYTIPFTVLGSEAANQLIDIEFVDVNRLATLLVLVSTDLGGKFIKIQCTTEKYNPIKEDLESINVVLQSIGAEQFKTKSYAEMFKCCITGHKYDAFHAKKKKLQEKAKQAKKMKLETG